MSARPRLLGAILCGGRSSRFGSDKALALLGGRPLIGRVRDALAGQVDATVCCGRALLGMEGIDDRPGPGLGPLGGLNAALQLAAARGFDAVLSAPCDAAGLPEDLAAQLGGRGPAYVADLPVVGLWPVALAPLLDRFVAEDARRSARGWADAAGARAVTLREPIANVNRPEDLAEFMASRNGAAAEAPPADRGTAAGSAASSRVPRRG